MPEYEYKAINSNCAEKNGRIKAVDYGEAISKLRQKKLYPVKLNIVFGMELTKTQKADYMKRFSPFSQKGLHPIMTLFDRLIKKIRLHFHYKREKQTRKNLLIRKDEIISNAFSILDAHLRKTSIAEPRGGRPPENMKASWFGNVLLCKEGESWPQWKHPVSLKTTYLTPLAQFNLTEAPYLPEKLRRFKMLAVFIDAEELPYERPHGEGWVVRAYESLEELVPLTRPDVEFDIEPFPIQWTLSEKDAPSWEDAWKITDLSDFNCVADSEYHDRYTSIENTKLGGYPALIQGELQFGIHDFIFQIGTEDKAGWYWGDSGIGYFGLDDKGKWLFEWTCY